MFLVVFLFLVFWSMVLPTCLSLVLAGSRELSKREECCIFWARGRSRPLRSRPRRSRWSRPRWSRPWWSRPLRSRPLRSRPQRRPRPFTAVCTYSALLALLSRFFSSSRQSTSSVSNRMSEISRGAGHDYSHAVQPFPVFSRTGRLPEAYPGYTSLPRP
jgi:hypothetical protein